MIPIRLLNLAILAGLALVAVQAHLAGELFTVTLATKAAILGLAGVGLNLALGYGGLVSFGHSAFFGIGGYAMGILASHAQDYTPVAFGLPGTNAMPVVWLVAVLASGLAALLIGALSLRTSGVYFIMITLAFSQMFYQFAISWPRYGGEDGILIYTRNAFPGLNTLDPIQFFGLAYGVLVAVIALVALLRASPFGLALNALRQSPARAETVGLDVFRLRLTAFVLSGMITGLAGALFADLNRYVSPSMLSWQISGELIVFVVLGGLGRLIGPVVGACVFVGLEEALGGVSDHWLMWLGLMLLGIVLFARGGIVGALARPRG